MIVFVPSLGLTLPGGWPGGATGGRPRPGGGAGGLRDRRGSVARRDSQRTNRSGQRIIQDTQRLRKPKTLTAVDGGCTSSSVAPSRPSPHRSKLFRYSGPTFVPLSISFRY